MQQFSGLTGRRWGKDRDERQRERSKDWDEHRRENDKEQREREKDRAERQRENDSEAQREQAERRVPSAAASAAAGTAPTY